MSEQRDHERDAAPPGPPETGEAAIDDALAGLGDLGSAPPAEQYDRLAAAHQVLQEALDRPAPDEPAAN